jgi:competence ComEA-like helix-hairpin-helix protein
LADVQVSAAVIERLLQLCTTGSMAELMRFQNKNIIFVVFKIVFVFSLQGVGRKRAEAIVLYRQERGANFAFVDISDLANCGMGKKTLENFLKRNIFV